LAGEWGLLPVPPKKPRRREAIMKNKDLALIALYAALYAAMVVVFTPISFSALQFRIAGVLRPGIAKKRELSAGYALGTVVANFFSPFAGIYEIAFMPLMSLLSGIIGFEIAKHNNQNYYVCGLVIAIIIPISVAWMLYQLFNISILVSLPGLVLSEQIVNFIGATVFREIEKRYEWWE
jgi:uncharacterized membrane protein